MQGNITGKEIAIIRKDIKDVFKMEDGWKFRIYRHTVRHHMYSPAVGMIKVHIIKAPIDYREFGIGTQCICRNGKYYYDVPMVQMIEQLIKIRWKAADRYINSFGHTITNVEQTFEYSIYVGHREAQFFFSNPKDLCKSWSEERIKKTEDKLRSSIALSLLRN